MPTADLCNEARVIDLMSWEVSPDSTAIGQLITSASEAVEKYLGKGVYATEYVEKQWGSGHGSLILRQYPVVEVTEVLIHPGQDAEYEIPDTDYLLDELTGLLFRGHSPCCGAVWNSCHLYQVTYTAGYGPAEGEDPDPLDAIPEDIQHACALLVADWYAARTHEAELQTTSTATSESDGSGESEAKNWYPAKPMPENVKKLLAPYRKHTR